MKQIISLTLAGSLATSTAMAGGMAEPIMVMEPEMVMVDDAGSSGDLLIPLILIALIAVATSDSGDAGGGLVLSDASVKTDIVPIGTAANGLPLYQYRYIGGSTVFEGVMAQDVLMHTPEAVVTLPSGIMAVNYDMLGLEVKVVQ